MLDAPMSDEKNYNVLTTESGVPIKAWTKGVQLEDQARKQLLNVAQLPFIFKWVAAMPDVHWGIGATVGSVIPTKGAIIPAAVGVDIGCGMMAVETDLNARDLPDNLKGMRSAIEKAVPHGRTNHGRRSSRDTTRFWKNIRSWIAAIIRITSARWVPATTSSKCAWMKRKTCGSCCTAARAVSATAWGATSSMSRARTCRDFSSTCRTRTWRIFRRARSTSTTMWKPSNGRRTSRAGTAT